ncbi:MAG: RNA polymerase sigma factor [Bacteroidia bacterium]|nr:RNA polymerase sigma factor [Bacteroidia bacterium]MCZ2248370.1 RNA polymerase sigma factor [Bacteroidia bacterium]
MTISEFNNCVDLYADSLFRFILKNIKDTEKAKDIVQDTYEKLWVKVSHVESKNAKSYMFTTAYRTMIDSIRKEKKYSTLEQIKEISISTTGATLSLRQNIDKGLERLPEIQRTVLLLRDYEGYDYAQIGEITGLNESQVKVYIYRARIAMKDYLVSIENLI